MSNLEANGNKLSVLFDSFAKANVTLKDSLAVRASIYFKPP